MTTSGQMNDKRPGRAIFVTVSSDSVSRTYRVSWISLALWGLPKPLEPVVRLKIAVRRTSRTLLPR